MFLIGPSRRSAIVAAATIAATLLPLACSSPVAPVPGLEIRPVASAFVRTPAGVAEVPYVVLNAGELPVVLVTRCGDRLVPVVQRRERGEWVQHSGGLCLGNMMASPVAVAPGERRNEIAVVAEPGQYRLVLNTEQGPVASTSFLIQ